MPVDFSEARKLERFPFLDAARGLASIVVVASHCNLNWFWGVMDFFFVMSGFLITRSLISNCAKGRGTFAFLLYRALRLLPAYLVVMLVYELAVIVSGARAPFETLPYLFFYQNTDLIFGSTMIFPRIQELVPCWSLVIEEQFYVLWGTFFCVFAFTRLKITTTTLAMAFLMACSAILMRCAGVHWWTLPGRFDGFLMGCVVSIIIFMPRKVLVPERWQGALLKTGWIVAAAALARLIWSSYLYYHDFDRYLTGIWLDITCFSIVSVVLILAMVKLDIRNIHFGKIQNGLAFLGLISYETYLVHFPIIEIIRRSLGYHPYQHRVPLFLAAMVVSSLVGWVMHRTLTAPSLKRREQVHAALENRFGGMLASLRFWRAQTESPRG